MRTNKKNISSFHDVRPPETFKPKEPLAVLASQRSGQDFEEQAEKIEVAVSGTPIEEVILRPKDSAALLSGLTRRNRVSGSTLINKRKSRSTLRSTILAALGLIVVLYGLSLYNLRDNARVTLGDIQNNITDAIIAFRNFKNENADLSLKNAGKKLAELNKELQQHGVLGISALLGTVFPAAEDARLTLENSKIALDNAIMVNESISTLKDSGLAYFMNGRGDKLTEILQSIQKNLKQIISSGETLQQLSSSLSNSIFSRYISLPDTASSNFESFKEGYAADEFLGAMITALTSDKPIHLLLLFQNQSEIRPSGGFLGSYASITTTGGALHDFDVRDIYDPDGWVKTKIVPPKPLQTITTNWDARDANWFLDFRTSAQKIISRLEDSLFYKEKSITFMGAVAMNTNVIEDLLNLTGQIPLPQYNLIITKENFLDKVQYEVEAGTDKAKNQPKKILSDMTPILLSRLAALNSEQKNQLFDLLQKHLAAKDIQIYFKDKSLEQFMGKYEIGGAIFDAPDNWSGEYLAVADANIAGGKTDAYIEQRIKLNSSLDISGKAINTLTVERNHKGGKTSYSWYNVTNKDYLHVLTPPGANLTGIRGATPRTIYPPINYKTNGYVTDLDISLLESSSTESGKKVFGAWRYTDPGSTSTIAFSYERPQAIRTERGTTYQFVFDKQSGVRSSLEYTVEAPPGFRWKESKKSIFNYVNDNPPARVMLNLTLEEI